MRYTHSDRIVRILSRHLRKDCTRAECRQIGGLGSIVEIDESEFGRRKSGKHGGHGNGQWVFGGVEKGSNRCFLVAVDDRSVETLIALVKKYIAPGSMIVSDGWRAYDTLCEEGYEHLRARYFMTFKDGETSANLDTVEGLWACVERQFPASNRKEGMFSSYLGEFMYQRLRNNVDDPFAAFLKDLVTVFPP